VAIEVYLKFEYAAFEYKSYFHFHSRQQNKLAITLKLRDAVLTMEQGRIEVPCVNGEANNIRSAN
jgi:hypothetical protein